MLRKDNKGFTPHLSQKGWGFTLIELIVVISIIGLLSTIALANYRTGGKQFALQRSAHGLAQGLRKVQATAMGAKELNGETPFRYGIEFEKDRDYYLLFADMNDNGRYEGAHDKEIEKIYFEKGVSIEGLFTPDSKTKVWVAFKPPDPLVTILDPGERLFLRVRLRLINADNQIKSVSINRAGLIEIE